MQSSGNASILNTYVITKIVIKMKKGSQKVELWVVKKKKSMKIVKITNKLVILNTPISKDSPH